MIKEELAIIASKTDNYLLSHPLRNIHPEYLEISLLHLLKNGGKRMRPALLNWFCGLNGGDLNQSLPIGAGMEIYHTWTLVHDDIIDKDLTRRGNPTTHVVLAEYARGNFEGKGHDEFGNSMAILTGDLQQAWALELVANSISTGVKPEVALGLISRINSYLTPSLISGEAIDVEFEYRQALDDNEIIKMMNLKTGALLEFCAQAGTCIALNIVDFNHPLVKSAGNFALKCGAAFQLQDDILGVYGEAPKFGKPLGTDICSGKKTLLMQKTFEKCTALEREYIISLNKSETLTVAQLNKVQAICQTSGALESINQIATDFVNEALDELTKFPKNLYTRLLISWAEYVTARKY